jgi:hypothetical protein
VERLEILRVSGENPSVERFGIIEFAAPVVRGGTPYHLGEIVLGGLQNFFRSGHREVALMRKNAQTQRHRITNEIMRSPQRRQPGIGTSPTSFGTL